LRRASRLQGWIRGDKGGEVVELKIGGVNRPPYHDQALPYQDSLDSQDVRLSLTTEWQRFVIPLPKSALLENVIGGAACVLSQPHNPAGAVIYLDELSYDNADPDGLRLIRSYTPAAALNLAIPDQPFRNAA